MAVLQEYKCPCCGGAIEFDSAAQKLKCPYCDTEFELETLAEYDNEVQGELETQMDWEHATDGRWQSGEMDSLCNYLCQSCGGEIVADENTAATACPYCGNPVVMTGKLSGSLRPDLVIPFRLDKKAAKAALKKHCEGKRLLPAMFRDENHIDEIKGVYVPFWLFDAGAEARIRYRATRVRTWSDRNYDYTETQYYSVVRGGTLAFADVPVDGSTKMTDELLESIEPFNLSQAVDFQTAYLAGYLADKYDVDAEQSIQRANERIRQSTEDAFAATVQGFATVEPVATGIQLEKGIVKYALLPVWILNTSWNGQNYLFAMNGQTGKMVGDLPLDKGAYRRWLFGLTGLIGAACFAAMYLLWLL